MRTTVILTAIATLSIGAAAPAADIDANSQKAIDAARAFYADIDTMHTRYKVTTEYSAMGTKQEQITTITIDATRPNQFAMHMDQDKMIQMIVVSDGTQLGTSASAPMMGLNAYTQEDAPETYAELLEQNKDLMFSTGPTGADCATLSTMFFLSPEDNEIFADLDSAVYAGVEEVDGVASHRVNTVFSTEIDGDVLSIPAVLWIRQGDEPWIQGVDPDLSKLMEQMAAQGQMPPGMTFKVKQRLVESSASPDFTADTFAFTPPAGAKKVDSLMDAMMGGGPNDASGAPDDAVHNGQGAQGPESLVGNPAPSFSLDLLSGGKVDLAQHKGKDIVVLDFWATWCGPCVKAMPTLIEVTDKFKDRNVVFYAVNLREDTDKINKFLEKKGFDTNVLLDKAGDTAMAYQARGIPQTVIIGKDGVVQAVHVGLSPDLKSKLTGELQKVVDGENLY